MIQGETGLDGGASTGDTDGASGVGSGDGSGDASDDVSAELFVSLDTSVASSSMVGGSRFGRLESGSDPVSSGLSSTITAVPLNG
jgi:hypothetical protein